MSARPLILVIGATGATGLPIVTALAKRSSVRVAALVRPASLTNTSHAARLAEFRSLGIEIRSGNVRDSEFDMRRWLDGVETVISCVVYGELLAQREVVSIAKQMGVKRFVPSDFAAACPKGVMALQDKKDIVHQYIIESGIGYTFIDTGSWYEVMLAEIDRTPFTGGPYPVPAPGPTKFVVIGSGDKPNAVTHLPDVGELVSRIVLDHRTLNKRVFCMGDAVTMNQMGKWYELETGKRLTWAKFNEDRLHKRIRAIRATLGPLEDDPVLPRELLGLEYNLSRWIRGDNMPPEGSLTSMELYPDYQCVKWRDWFRSVVKKGQVGMKL
ncbi:hypothetical protein HDU93_000138 [Gonapodya sp. JEL0774]|nr:hypothetical protein HDU93_000138 [Gonapodya sp. JEL0774]